MSKTLQEFLIFAAILLITIGIGYGGIKVYEITKDNENKNNKNDGLNIKWELKLKDLIKKQIEREERIIYKKEINDAMEMIKYRLLKHVESNPYEVEITVIDSPVINAAAFPGGYIVIFSGLLKLADNPEQIASILAHELGHVVHKDVIQALKRQFGIAVLFSIVTGTDTTIIEQMIRNVLANQFSQTMEKKADEFACHLLIKAGINPRHFADIFKKMNEIDENKIDKRIIKYFGTHPDIESRIKETESISKLFRGEEEKLNIDWKKLKKSLPSVLD